MHCMQVRTVIGQGSAKQGTGHVHGAPLGAADLANVKKHFGFNPEEVRRPFPEYNLNIYNLLYVCMCMNM